MSKDIRSFFTVLSKKQGSTKNAVLTPPKSSNKRAKRIHSSDEDIVEATPPLTNKKHESKQQKKRKVQLISSDSEDEFNKSKPTNVAKKTVPEILKPVDALDVFGNTPVKQSKVQQTEVHQGKRPAESEKSETKIRPKKKRSKKLNTELGVHDDPNFEKCLLDLDDDFLMDEGLNKTIDDALNGSSQIANGNTDAVELNRSKNLSAKLAGDKVVGTPKRKRSENEASDVDMDQERYEKRRQSAALYQKYLNRSGPLHHGSKELPKGKPDCLDGLCFLKTGVLDSLDSEEFEDLVKNHGGRVVHAVSKKVNYVVAGDEPGPAKLEKARNYHIKIISEDEVLDLILTKSGMPAKYNVNADDVTEIDENSSKTLRVTEIKSELKPRGEASRKPNFKKLNGQTSKGSVEATDDNNKNKSKTNKKLTKQARDDEIPEITRKKSASKNNSVIQSKTEHTKIVAGKNLEHIDRPTLLIPDNNLAWTEKYKPASISAIIGQQGDKSNMKKLLFWLQNWHKNHTGKNKPKLVRPSPWAKSDDGAYFKCALLSGPPGVGKTTTATLVANELGFDVVEFNASDTRSKKLLHEEVSQLLNSTSIASYVKDGSAPTKKHVLLMDEVDGMAGNEDRGGVQELIALVKNSNIPVICMCNDRNHPKIRSLANYCLDLRFARPRLEQIRGAMMSVCFKEGLKISPEALAQVISGAGMDVRQTLTHLSMWTASQKALTSEVAQKEARAAKKDTVLGPWEVVRKVFSKEEHKDMSLADKSKLFFYDYSIGPLFVHENYLQVVPHCPKSEILQRVADTADCLSTGVIIENKIRTSNNWSLLEVQGMYASVLPGYYMEGHVGGQINFPGWLGKNSRRNKFLRLLTELQTHMRTSVNASRSAVNLDYIYYLRDNIIDPLKEGTNGVGKSLSVMHAYNLLREDFDTLVELSHWPRHKDPMAMVDSKVKAAFTRAYNKEGYKLPYAISSAAIKKKTTASSQEDELYGEEEDAESSPEDDDVTKDAMIKAKKKPTGKGKKEVAEASTSKQPPKKGKGKKTK